MPILPRQAGGGAADDAMSQWFVYMVRASDDSLYTGITTDLARRLAEHQAGKAGAKYFRGRSAMAIAVSYTHRTRPTSCTGKILVGAVSCK